jgi:molybdenum cofactor biosynthesis enzyme MoaA
MYDFANLLFSGPCNARCPFCIGKQLDPALNQNNLKQYPPQNLDAWIELIQRYEIHQVVFTGSNTDPQLYRHEERLLATLRRELPGETQFSLHTNGLLALRKMAVFNQYDRVTISIPSFNPDTYRRMMGGPIPPDLDRIAAKTAVPIKVSCAITENNRAELPSFLARCNQTGIRRVVLRKLYGETRSWTEILPWENLNLIQTGVYRGNPVYETYGLQVTLWDFTETTSTSINLFSNGQISTKYLLSEGLIPAGGNRLA